VAKGLRWLLVLLSASVVLAQVPLQILHALSASDSVIGGEPIRVIVQLTGPAGGGQLPVSTNHPELCQAVPVQVRTGQSEVRFAVPTREVDTPTQVVISVGFYGNIRDLQVTLQPDAAVVTQLRMPARMIAGDNGSVLVVLDRLSGRSARLSLVGNENVSIAGSLAIPPGVRQFEAPFSTRVLRQGGSAILTYQGARVVTGQSQLLPPVEVSDLQFTPATVEGGQGGTGIVSLKAPAGAAARVKLTGPANLRLPAEVIVAEGAALAQFRFTSAPARASQTYSVVAATPVGQKAANLTISPSTSLAASEAAQYYLMAGSKDGWLTVADSTGKKWRFKPSVAPRLGQLEPFGYLAMVQGEGTQEGDGTAHSLVVQLRVAGSKDEWKVTEAVVIQVDGAAR
jgi:hypothetical protein